MNGTEWTEPGQGATVSELIKATRATKLIQPCWMGVAQLWDGATHHSGYIKATKRTDRIRTNLRLTGAPLQASDLENIAKCK